MCELHVYLPSYKHLQMQYLMPHMFFAFAHMAHTRVMHVLFKLWVICTVCKLSVTVHCLHSHQEFTVTFVKKLESCSTCLIG